MERALEAAVHHWRFFAQRYQHIPSAELSFDLFNEPPWMKDHDRSIEIARALVAAIREVSPDRLIVADGADIGQTPVMGLVDVESPRQIRHRRQRSSRRRLRGLRGPQTRPHDA